MTAARLPTRLALAALAALACGCAGAPTHSYQPQDHALAGVPPGLAVGVMQVIVTSRQGRKHARALHDSILAELRDRKLFARVEPADRRDDPRYDLVLDLTVAEEARPGESGPYVVAVAHDIRLWSRGREVAYFRVINTATLPLGLFTRPKDHDERATAYERTPRLAADHVAFGARQLTGR